MPRVPGSQDPERNRRIGDERVLRPARPVRLTGSEAIAGDRATLAEFWSWAFSDLRENVTRGILAEWLVGLALGCVDGVRQGWDNVDLLTAEGVSVEVKSASYLQAWPTPRHSRIVFSGLRGRAWDPETGAFAKEPTYRADVYVFCLQTGRDHASFDPLDVDQWRFWVASRDVVAGPGYRSLALSAIERMASGPMELDEVPDAVRRAAGLRVP